MSNSKFECFLFFSVNFSNKIFANVLFFVRATYFAGTTRPTTAPKDELCIIEEDEEGDSDVIID